MVAFSLELVFYEFSYRNLILLKIFKDIQISKYLLQVKDKNIF